MPQVPVYEPDQVRLRPVDTTARQGLPEAAFGGQVGQALGQFGKALNQGADVAEHIADQQAETKARNADVELSSHIREELYGEHGLLNLQGQAFVEAAPETLKRIEEKARALKESGGNRFESEMLGRVTTQRLDAVRTQVGGQTIRETQFANKAAASARAENQQTNAAFAYRDPQAYRTERAALDAAIVDQAEATGVRDPATLLAMKRERYNNIHAYAVQDMIRRGEVGQAQAWLDDALVKGELKPEIATQLQDHLEKAVEETELGYLAEGRTPPSPVDGKMLAPSPELVAAMGWQESRGNGNAVSPKGAEGVMQVMPATGPEAARLAGVPWQPERMHSRLPADVAYQQKLGNAYMGAQLKRFGGSVVVALAAYNAGPERAEAWVKQFGDPAKGQIDPKAWAAKVPFPETRDYIAKITARLGGTTKEPLPQSVRTVAQVDTWAKQFDDPKEREKARAAGYAVVNRNRAAENQRQADAWDAAQPYIQQGQPWTAIPKAVWNSMSPQNQTSLIDMTKRGANRVTSPEALDGIYTLMERDPAAFKSMDLLRLAPDFSPGDFEQLRKMQHDALQGRGEFKTPQAQYSAVNRLAATVAPPTMLRPNAKAELARFKAQWFQAVQAKQAGQTDPLTDDEVMEIGTRLTMEVAVGKKGHGPFAHDETQPLYKFAVDPNKNLAENAQHIPPGDKAEVIQFLTRRDGKVPTEGKVLETWRTLKASGKL